MASPRRKPGSPAVASSPGFTAAGLRFLRSLVRNNDRDWFNERRDTYERELKAPMLALIERLNVTMDEIAPAHVRQPQKVMLRIFRDTRFSKDKRPLKHHVGAWWGLPGNERSTGTGFYLHVGGKEVVLAAGIYMPTPDHLLALRRWFLTSHEQARDLVAKACRDTPFMPEDSRPMTRVPRGFPADHPAADLLKGRLLAVSAELPPETALDPNFPALVDRAFRAAAPLVTAMDAVIGKGSSPQRV